VNITPIRPSRLCLGVAALLPFSSAFAQSNVTLYGVYDAGVERVTNVGPSRGSVVRMPSITGSLPSRLGFRGSEDLGDGLKAVFVLESGFAPDQGTYNQSNRAFGRQAYVGLQGSWGQVSFGRQYSQLVWGLIGDTMGPSIYVAALLDTYIPNARVDNAVAYRGNFGDFTVGTTYSLGRDTQGPAVAGGCAGEVAGDAKACRHLSWTLQYATKEWGLALTSDRMWGGNAAAGSPLPLSSQRDTRNLLSGFYVIGPVKLGAGVLQRNNEGSVTPKSNWSFLGGSYALGQWQFDAQVGRLDIKNSPNDGNVLAGRVAFNFSKRTAAYFTAGRLNNKGASALTVDGGVVAGSSPSPGVGQTGTMIGLRHIF
jgi:predicted porin